MKTLISLFILCIVPHVCNAGTYRAYTGPELPRNQVAVLKLEARLGAAVDGQWAQTCVKRLAKTASCSLADAVELLPGTHTVQFVFGGEGAAVYGVTADPIVKTLSFEAGRTYVAKKQWCWASPCQTVRGKPKPHPDDAAKGTGSWNAPGMGRPSPGMRTIVYGTGAILWWIEMTGW